MQELLPHVLWPTLWILSSKGSELRGPSPVIISIMFLCSALICRPPSTFTFLFITLPSARALVLLAASLSNNVCRAYKTFIMGYKIWLWWRAPRVEGGLEQDGGSRWDRRVEQRTSAGAEQSKPLRLVMLRKVFQVTSHNCSAVIWVVNPLMHLLTLCFVLMCEISSNFSRTSMSILKPTKCQAWLLYLIGNSRGVIKFLGISADFPRA